jgi:serine/threonine protein kinase
MAEQQQPIRRKVALKVLKLGMDTRHVIVRFEAERQALALMDHPNVAKVLGAGQTSTGRPYFVMDLVRGIPITEYCDQNQLPVQERLDVAISRRHGLQFFSGGGGIAVGRLAVARTRYVIINVVPTGWTSVSLC